MEFSPDAAEPYDRAGTGGPGITSQHFCGRCPHSELCSLHECVLQGKRTQCEELIRQLLGWLYRKASGRFPCQQGATILDAVHDALLGYLRKPQDFDPTRGVPLDWYLLLTSIRNVQDALRLQSRRRSREQFAMQSFFENVVELRGTAANTYMEPSIDLPRLLQRLAWLEGKVVKDPTDRALLGLWKNNERDSASFAKALGVQHLGAQEQARAVKRAKDRLIKALQRAWNRRSRKLEDEA